MSWQDSLFSVFDRVEWFATGPLAYVTVARLPLLTTPGSLNCAVKAKPPQAAVRGSLDGVAEQTYKGSQGRTTDSDEQQR